MFCAECGTKNKLASKFCKNCGAKLKKETMKQTKIPHKERKPMTHKNKVMLSFLVLCFIILIVGYNVLHYLTSPKKIAEDFFKASTHYDIDRTYEYLDIVDSEFTSKDMFKRVVKNSIKEENKIKVINYQVESTTIDGFRAKVTMTYMVQGDASAKTMDITLVKEKKKKWLLFDSWKVVTKNETVKDYKIKVMKGSEVMVEGIKLSSKYLDKISSTETIDVYSLPFIFHTKYNVKISLPIGITVEDTMGVSSYSAYTYELSLNDLSEESKNQFKDVAKSNLQTLYDGAREKKSFDDIKEALIDKDMEAADLKNTYDSLVRDLGKDYTLTSITFKDVNLKSLTMDSDGHLELYTKVTYDYTISYTSKEGEKVSQSSDEDSVYLTYDYIDGEYMLLDALSLNTYFSKS